MQFSSVIYDNEQLNKTGKRRASTLLMRTYEYSSNKATHYSPVYGDHSSCRTANFLLSQLLLVSY